MDSSNLAKSEIAAKVDSIVKKSKLDHSGSGFLSILIMPLVHFVKAYIIKGGVVKGTAGFVDSILASLEPFVTKGNAYVKERK